MVLPEPEQGRLDLDPTETWARSDHRQEKQTGPEFDPPKGKEKQGPNPDRILFLSIFYNKKIRRYRTLSLLQYWSRLRVQVDPAKLNTLKELINAPNYKENMATLIRYTRRC